MEESWLSHAEQTLADLIEDLNEAAAERGFPTGGTTGQVLKKKSNTDFDTEWANESAGVSDVQVNGTSVVTSGVANIPAASSDSLGVVQVDSNKGIALEDGKLSIVRPSEYYYKKGDNNYKPVTVYGQHMSTFYGLAKAAGADMKDISSTTVGTYPETQKSAINSMLNAPETVSGSTPSITAKAGVRYVCGEVSTLTIVTPASGIIDVIFESGSTPTVLTVTPPTGMTMKWANGFDPTSLEADTVYEINIMDGVYGVVASWT